MKILIADDSAPLRQRLVEMLSRIREIEAVEQAQDVSETLDSLRAFQPNVLILDLQMPGGSGVDVLREVKQNHPSIVTIVLTNHPDPQYRKTCAELGARYFLSKSFGLEPLIEICGRLAGAKGHE